jgi:uncharacterized protein YacL
MNFIVSLLESVLVGFGFMVLAAILVEVVLNGSMKIQNTDVQTAVTVISFFIGFSCSMLFIKITDHIEEAKKEILKKIEEKIPTKK